MWRTPIQLNIGDSDIKKCFNGVVGEIILFNEYVEDAKLTELHNLLKEKYGI